jgi:sugar-specific transcriptional regulator TrmB
MLRNLLNTCGLNPSEQTVLVHLLERGEGIASTIAKYVKLKRPTVYAALDSLVRRGLVSRQKRNATTYFKVAPKKRIPEIFRYEAQEYVDDIQHAANVLEKELDALTPPEHIKLAGFDISTLESMGAIESQLEELLLSGDFCAMYNPQIAIQGRVKTIIADFLEKTAINKPHIREIVVDGPMADWYVERINNSNHVVKRIPKSKKIMSDIIIKDGWVVLSHYDVDSHLAVRIEHPGFFQSMQTLFDIMWTDVAN